MKRFLSMLALLAGSISSAQAAGIDETINAATAPVASFIGDVVFFKIFFPRRSVFCLKSSIENFCELNFVFVSGTIIGKTRIV